PARPWAAADECERALRSLEDAGRAGEAPRGRGGGEHALDRGKRGLRAVVVPTAGDGLERAADRRGCDPERGGRVVVGELPERGDGSGGGHRSDDGRDPPASLGRARKEDVD